MAEAKTKPAARRKPSATKPSAKTPAAKKPAAKKKPVGRKKPAPRKKLLRKDGTQDRRTLSGEDILQNFTTFGHEDTEENRGRPTIYTHEIAARICAMIAEGRSLTSICRDPAMPARSTVMYWLLDPDHALFLDRYKLAREMQTDGLIEATMDIASDAQNDYMERETRSGAVVKAVDHDHIQRSRLMVDTAFRLAEKMAPKKYGKAVRIDAPDLGRAIQDASDSELDRQIALAVGELAKATGQATDSPT